MRDFGFGDDQNCEELYGCKTVLFDGPLKISGQSRTTNGVVVTVTPGRDPSNVNVNVVTYCSRVAEGLQ